MRHGIFILSYILVLLSFILPAYCDPLHITMTSGENRVSLLELFTSEGCSSCPPAEAWVSALKADPRLWRQFIPIAFHVTYWDYLGWSDPYANKAYSERQRRYAAVWRNASVYTPGLVMNGREWRGWSKYKLLEFPAIERVGELKLNVDKEQITIHFTPLESITHAPQINMVLLGCGLETDVKAGENRNRTLHHDFVVLLWEQYPLARQSDGAYFLSRAMPSRNDIKAQRNALAAWVDTAENPEPIQAVGGWLNSTP